MNKYLKSTIIEFCIALTAFISVLVLIRFSNLDLIISDAAYDYTAFQTTNYLDIAAWAGKYASVIFCTIMILLLPWLWKSNHPFKKEATFAVALLLIGPGLSSNLIFKPFFKRPRPVQITRYSIEKAANFVPPLNRGTNKEDTSFPSGHAGAAFFFIFPWFCPELRKKYGILILTPGFLYGLSTGAIRILQGRHFSSDIIASLGVVYLSATVLSYFFFKHKGETDATKEQPA